MALQADKKRLLMFFASIGFIIVFSQVVGYQLSVSKRKGRESSRGVLLPSAQATLLRDGTHGREAGSMLLDLQAGEGEQAIRGQVIVSLNLKQAPAVGRLLMDLCAFNKLAGKQVARSGRVNGAVDASLGAPIAQAAQQGAAGAALEPSVSLGAVAVAVQGALADEGVVALFTEPGRGGSEWLPIGMLEGISVEVLAKIPAGRSMEIKDCRQM
eukprot:CAMPEP_0117683938 /NCGR_PEP_ID=MMETSP0804-20121206/20756_1 /TAXON_ID=1074897 /ORGANISM="Tetraselmis astigmatica, Strain CCMP880" /LENGTH=212 /DNA_ID=CAMNT_0005494743 /DNA_START=20 /DNA_END=655 /DNA_ORIENTATION=+